MDWRYHGIHDDGTAWGFGRICHLPLFDKAGDAQAAQDGYSQDNVYMGQRNSFLFSMLVMSSYIIRADGRIMHSEMEYVRQFLRMNFGEAAVDEGERILLNLFEQRKQMERTDPLAFKKYHP